MEKPNESVTILNMFPHPVLLVKDGMIASVNDAATAKGFAPDTAISDLLTDALDEYQAYTGGYLSLTVAYKGIDYLATVIRSESGDVFHLGSANLSAEFRTMALIAQLLRQPLSGVMMAADSLFPAIADDPENKVQVAQMNRNLYQLLRNVSNLSAVQRMTEQQSCAYRTQNISGLICEVMERATAFADHKRTLEFTGLYEDIHSLADSELIERALYNLISNAVKFSPENTVVSAKLTRVGNKLRFSIANQVSENLDRGNLFARFMREPGVEDSRHGIGLGLPLIQYVCAAHSGSLLMDMPEANSVRFTMTLPIKQSTDAVVRSPVLSFDYLGGYDHALVELSDVLSDSLYADLY